MEPCVTEYKIFLTFIPVSHSQRHQAPIYKECNGLIPDCTSSSCCDLHFAGLTWTGHQHGGVVEGGGGKECQCNYYNTANDIPTFPSTISKPITFSQWLGCRSGGVETWSDRYVQYQIYTVLNQIRSRITSEQSPRSRPRTWQLNQHTFPKPCQISHFHQSTDWSFSTAKIIVLYLLCGHKIP